MRPPPLEVTAERTVVNQGLVHREPLELTASRGAVQNPSPAPPITLRGCSTLRDSRDARLGDRSYGCSRR
jgi:hypothetical protein